MSIGAATFGRQAIISFYLKHDSSDESSMFDITDDGRSAGVQIRNAESKAQVN